MSRPDWKPCGRYPGCGCEDACSYWDVTGLKPVADEEPEPADD